MTTLGKAWTEIGDVNWRDYGAKWLRHVGGRRYHVIEFTNMDDACGRDNEGRDPYIVELSLVDLDALTERDIASAIRSCGAEDETLDDLWLAECVYSYGNKAPLWSDEGRNAYAMLRSARSESARLRRDDAAMDDALARPVNKIGSTAAEYMRGDINSAILRGLADGNPAAEIMAKMGMLRR